MLVAHHLAAECLPSYSSEFSRHDFTLPQLFACLAVKEMLGCSYRGAEELLRDAHHWCRAIGMSKTPDHNTLWRAARFLLHRSKANRLLDIMCQWGAQARMLGFSIKPLAIDSSCFEPHHVSRYFDHRRLHGRKGGGRGRRRKMQAIPKLAVGVSCWSHLVLSLWTGIGGGGDLPQFEPLLFDAWRRAPGRSLSKVVADAGYDAEYNHELARYDMSIRSIILAKIGRQFVDGSPPRGRWRRCMRRWLETKRSRQCCGYTQRWQVETVNSMIKRNLGSACRGRSSKSRQADLRLKVLTHNLMILRRHWRIETGHFRPL
jgi:Transposase DDE domain/Transposase domain (DUF772)